MALITETKARQIVEDERERILEMRYPEDYSSELAESYTPIYNSDIYAQWGDLPREAQDEWRAYGMEVEDTISGMRIDIHIYADSLFSGAIAQLLEDAEVN